jgi:uncharacterized protein
VKYAERAGQTRVTETMTTVRAAADAPRTIEGIAVPYGMVASDTEYGRETFAPGAFRESVTHWMARQDGARMAFRPAHREKPIGTVTELSETPDGVRFRAAIFATPAGDEYLAQVGEGLNGVSVEAGLDPRPTRTRDGTAVHRTARLYAIAGSVNPAYDGARVSLRDLEDAPVNCHLCSSTMTAGVAHSCATSNPVPAVSAEVSRDAATTPTAEAIVAQRSAVLGDALVQSDRRPGIVITRDAAIYGREAASLDNGRPASFFGDGWAAQNGDRDASERQFRYQTAMSDLSRKLERDATVAFRAGDVISSEIGGAYPNEYLPGLFTPRLIKGRPMGGFYNRFPISDALPKIFAKVTTSTSVAVQSAELSNPAASDFATTAVTATPLLYGGETVVSRQVLDGSSPAAEVMLMQDLFESYAQASELVIVTAVEAGASASGTAITAATPYAGVQGNVIKYATTRFRPAEGQFVPSALFAVLASENDTTGRPKLPAVGPMNSDGTKSGVLGYDLLGARGAMSYQSTSNVVVTATASDYVIFESPIARFSYDATTGPAGVRVGIWAYLVVGARLGSLKVTAA